MVVVCAHHHHERSAAAGYLPPSPPTRHRHFLLTRSRFVYVLMIWCFCVGIDSKSS